MKTLIIRIDAAGAGGHPVSLLELEQPEADSSEPLAPTPIALSAIHLPPSLEPPGPGGTSFSAAEMATKLREAETAEPALRTIGEQLWALLDQGPVSAALPDPGAGWRVMLDIRDKDLESVPWELLCRSGDLQRLFIDRNLPFCRGSLPEGPRLASHGWPLRIMIVVGSEVGDGAVAEGEELEGINDVLVDADPDIDVLVVKRPNLKTLSRELLGFRPHVFHFLGHGQILAGEASLKLDPHGELWVPDRIRQDIGQAGSLRLAFLNACRSGDAAKKGLWSMTEAFLQAGVPAVVGMRTDVDGRGAARCAKALYAALAGGDPVDVAMAKARQQIHEVDEDGLQRREWASPSLHVAELPERILRIGRGIEDERRKAVGWVAKFQSLRTDFIDRHDERRKAWQGLDEKGSNLVVISGKTGSGKTEFAHLLMERCALCEHEVRYVDLRGEKGEFIHLLRQVRHGHGGLRSSSKLLTNPLEPPEAFQAFDAQVEEILGQPLKDFAGRMTPEQYLKVDQILATFQASLKTAARDAPMMLVFDHFESFEPSEFTNYVRPGLLEWCAEPGQEQIAVVLVLTPTDQKKFFMEELAGFFHQVTVPLFKAAEWDELAWEFIRRNQRSRKFADDQARSEFFDTARQFVAVAGKMWVEKPEWKPHLLLKLVEED